MPTSQSQASIPSLLPPGRVLPASFFARASEKVAPDLLGKILWRDGVGGGRLTEVEAYLPDNDPACHAAHGQTERNSAMFGSPGCAYLYLSYGVHVLLNLVCDDESRGSAVLIRAFEPLGDVTQLRRNRLVRSQAIDASAGTTLGTSRPDPWLSTGPGRVGQALALTLELNGLPLGEASGLYIIDDGARPEIVCTTRVGISQGSHLPLRFYVSGTKCVTHAPRRGGRKA